MAGADPLGQIWTGEKALNPFNEFGRFTRTDRVWAGWLYATDADTGVWKWRLKSNYPIFGAVTPTGGGLVFFGDMGGNFYALDTTTGQKLWGQKIDGAIGGGVITYTAQDGKQKVAAAIGFTSIMWPTHITTGKVVVLGVDERGNALVCRRPFAGVSRARFARRRFDDADFPSNRRKRLR